MTSLDVSFSQSLCEPFGVVFIVTTIFIEALLLSSLLSEIHLNRRIWFIVVGANITSGIVGFLVTTVLFKGCWPVVWLPWVSCSDIEAPCDINSFIIYYLLAFLVTVLVEITINSLLLKKRYSLSSIAKSTLLVNLLSFVLGSLALYSYTFFC